MYLSATLGDRLLYNYLLEISPGKLTGSAKYQEEKKMILFIFPAYFSLFSLYFFPSSSG